jgi:hypothetical protein
MTIPQLCAAEITTKPMNVAQAQANWTAVSAMNKLLCCILDTEVITDVLSKVFCASTPTTVFDMGIVLPTDSDLFEVQWNGQDIYHSLNANAGEVKFSIAGNTIVLTSAIGEVGSPCNLAVKVKLKQKIGDVLDCPDMMTPTNSCNCLCGC